MKTTEFEQTVEEVERLLAKRQHSREEILSVLLEVTRNAIHVIEDKELRERVERAYIKALGFLSAVEEQLQIYGSTKPPSHRDLFIDGMMREVFTHLWALRSWLPRGPTGSNSKST
jgi:hypothetical protein